MTDKRETVAVEITHRSPEWREPTGRTINVFLDEDGNINHDTIIHEAIDYLYGIEKGESLTITIK